LKLINISLVCTNLNQYNYHLQLHIREAAIKLTEDPLRPVTVRISAYMI